MSHVRELQLLKRGSIIAIILLLFGVYFFEVDPKVRPAIKFFNDPLSIQLEKEVYERGEVVYGYTSFCKTRTSSGQIQWTLANERLITYSAHYSKNIPVGSCFNDIKFPIERIPDDAVSGEHYFSAVITHNFTYGRKNEVELKTETFLVK